MPAIFSKNCIVAGALDSYCLVCSTLLPDKEDVLAHIQDSKHTALLKPIVYLEKYKEDFIKKVNGVYFCEVCNMTFSTTAKVGIHVTEETHAKGRRGQLKRVGTSIVLQKDTLIEERAWHGLIDDTCVLCNVEFEDASLHRAKPSHILNLVRSALTIDENNNAYRKVDDGYHCLTCNLIIANNLNTDHFNSVNHKTTVNNKNSKDDITHSKEEKTKGPNKEKDVKKKNVNRNINNETLNDDEDGENKSHGQSSNTDDYALLNDEEKQTALESEVKKIEALAKRFGLSIQDDNSIVYCKTCNLRIPATFNCVEEHVDKAHRRMSPSHSGKEQSPNHIERINTKDFLKQIVRFDLMDDTYMIINDEFCITASDYCGVSKENNKIFCHFCRKTVNYEDLEIHLLLPAHKRNMDNSYVITSMKNEFVRQINGDSYHCGYCGEVTRGFDSMLDHVLTIQHTIFKGICDGSFGQYKQAQSFRRRTNFR